MRYAVQLACLFILHASCSREVRKVPEGVQGGRLAANSADELKDKEQRDFVEKARREYLAYSKLSVAFTLKGKIANEELYYEGELSSDDQLLKIKLKDAVFLSPLLTLEIGKSTVVLRNHAQNKVESIPRSQYQWVELFGRAFPVRFFEPLMRGYLPPDATDKESLFARTAAGDTLVRADNSSFEAALYFAEFKLKKIFYRDKETGDILIFQMLQLFKARNYPQVLRIEHSRTNDNLTLTFRDLKVK